MERSGPSIERKIVLLVALALIVQDIILLAMYLNGVPPQSIQVVLGGLLVLSLIVAAVWGNSVGRAIGRLRRACYVARKGDTRVPTELSRTDELRQLNDEINLLVEVVSDVERLRGDRLAAGDVAGTVAELESEISRSSHEILVSLKELGEGASAEGVLLGRLRDSIEHARATLAPATREPGRVDSDEEVAIRARSLGGLVREVELLSDELVDEIARPSIDEAGVARAVNGIRDSARALAEVASQTAGVLDRRRTEMAAARKVIEGLGSAEADRSDAERVAFLMQRSASSGSGAARRLGAALRRIAISVEAYERRLRQER